MFDIAVLQSHENRSISTEVNAFHISQLPCGHIGSWNKLDLCAT